MGAGKVGARGLTLQQKLFAEKYITQSPFFNASKAAIAAGYSPNSVSVIASKVLNMPKVQAYIEELRSAARIRNNITLDDLINLYAKIAFFDPRTIYNDDGGLKGISEFDDVAATAMASMDIEEMKIDGMKIGDLKKIRTYDRIVAADRLRECLGWKERERNRSIKRDAEGHIVETIETEPITEDKIIFEDHSKARPDGNL